VRWRCPRCGREYAADDPPCETCGHGTFEPIEEGAKSPFGGDSLVWVCPNCGREHVKHSPPCSRCGNHTLEKRDTGDVDLSEELSAPGYLSVGKPYILGVVVVLAVVALALGGVLPIPGLSGPPAPPDAPGDADRSGGLELDAVEAELHDRFNAERVADGGTERTRGDGLDAFAEYATRHYVAERYDPDYDGSVPEFGAFDPRCSRSPTFVIGDPEVDPGAAGEEAAFADALADRLLSGGEFTGAVLGEGESEGIDVHVGPDGTVFVGYIGC